ncbi:hypothetical protein WICPIJ_003318 [Wickerhamomyces pijperi]|uniref:Uncharacterized protein n=1 Tax=Wickerhamomyces pijperi TaxID=599730 RepID=A0A9P8Q7K8_WICPI|nr:hypothetical protein WICPIJ_003318 [Wickerhamomyces pijperi]
MTYSLCKPSPWVSGATSLPFWYFKTAAGDLATVHVLICSPPNDLNPDSAARCKLEESSTAKDGSFQEPFSLTIKYSDLWSALSKDLISLSSSALVVLEFGTTALLKSDILSSSSDFGMITSCFSLLSLLWTISGIPFLKKTPGCLETGPFWALTKRRSDREPFL